MKKSIKRELEKETNDIYNMDDRLDNVISKIEFNEDNIPSRPSFNFKLILYPVVTLLLCFVTSLSTYFITNSMLNGNSHHGTSNNENEYIEVALEQIKGYCDTYQKSPEYTFRTKGLIYTYIYSGEKVNNDLFEKMYFIQLVYLVDNDIDSYINIYNQDNDIRTINNPNHQEVYLINDNFEITDEITISIYLNKNEILKNTLNLNI